MAFWQLTCWVPSTLKWQRAKDLGLRAKGFEKALLLVNEISHKVTKYHLMLFHRKVGRKKTGWPLQLVQLALVLGKCATCTKICRRNAEKLRFFSGGPVRFSRPGCLPPLRLWWHTKSMISLINEICHLCQRAWPHSIDSH